MTALDRRQAGMSCQFAELLWIIDNYEEGLG